MGPGVRIGGRLIALLAAVALLAASAGTTRAAAAVYWGSDRDGVSAANLDGTNPQWNYFYVPFASEGSGPVCGVAVSPEYLYWASHGAISRRKLDGENLYPTTLVPHLNSPCGLASDGNHLYWASLGANPPAGPRAGSLGRANMDGSEATSTFVTGLESPCAITVAEGHVFWVEHSSISESRGIGRANIDGSAPQSTFIPFPDRNPSCGIAAYGGYLYWGQGEAIARARLDGSERDPSFIANTGVVGGIAIQAGRIYWVTNPPVGAASVGRANLDGSEANGSWILSGERGIGGIAVDERPTPPELTLPSRPIEITPNVEFNLRSGAARLNVYVPPSGPLAALTPPQGELTVVSRGLSWKAFGGTVADPSHAGSYLWQVRIRSGRGAVGRRIRAQLRRRGWARATVRLSYTQPRVYAVEAARTVILRSYPGAHAGWVKHPRPPKTNRGR